MENNELTPEEEREILIRELSEKAEELRIKYPYPTSVEEEQLNDIWEKIALLESQKNG